MTSYINIKTRLQNQLKPFLSAQEKEDKSVFSNLFCNAVLFYQSRAIIFKQKIDTLLQFEKPASTIYSLSKRVVGQERNI